MPCIKSPGAAQLEQYTARRAHCFDAAEQAKVSVAVGTGNLPRTQIEICLGMDVLYPYYIPEVGVKFPWQKYIFLI